MAHELAESLPLANDQECVEMLGIDILKASASFFEGLAYTMLVESEISSERRQLPNSTSFRRADDKLKECNAILQMREDAAPALKVQMS